MRRTKLTLANKPFTQAIALVFTAVFSSAGIATILFSPDADAQKIDKALKEQVTSQQHSINAQKKIDTLEDSRQSKADKYRTTIEQTDDLNIYNAQLRRLIQSQEREIEQYDRDLSDLEQTRRRLMPLMWQMTEALEKIFEVDTPFLQKERSLRLEELKTLMDRADITVADKYRRLMEAYQIEAEYGHTIEAYQGEVNLDGDVRTVDFLRFGRVGLYFLSLDGNSAGVWNLYQSNWEPLDDEFKEQLAQGIRIARKQMPPNLIRLPVHPPLVSQAGVEK